MNNSSHQEDDERRYEEELAKAILAYLAEHPHASDTLEGIAAWWITRQRIRVEVNRVAKVLRRLTKGGLLEETEPGENPRYRLKAKEDGLSSLGDESLDKE